MSQPLPTGAFQLVEECDKLTASIADHLTDSPEGDIPEVDVEYPQELHNIHNACSLVLDFMTIHKEWMSEYQQQVLDVGSAPIGIEKLVPNLHNNQHYPLHYRTLDSTSH